MTMTTNVAMVNTSGAAVQGDALDNLRRRPTTSKRATEEAKTKAKTVVERVGEASDRISRSPSGPAQSNFFGRSNRVKT